MAELETDLKKKSRQQQSGDLYVQAKTSQQGNAGSVSLAQASPAAARTQNVGANLSGVSDATKSGLSRYSAQYTPSQKVNDAEAYLQNVMNGRPGDFQSRYAGDIARLYDQIMNRPKFQYDVNKDPLFQQYKNQYTVQGQRAMQDTVGQMAGLTGGYGNSWGATVGSQAYQAYLQQLNDRIPELEQRAFDRYTAEGDEMRANMDLTRALEDMDYSRYRDTVSDWQTDRNFANILYSQERNWEQTDWQNMRNYYTTLANMENSDYWTGENFTENQRQFNETLAENKRQADMLEAYRRDELAERARQFDADLAERIRSTDLEDRREWARIEEEARKFNEELAERVREYDTTFAENKRIADRDFEEAQRISNRDFDYQAERDWIEDQRNERDFAENQRRYDQGFAEGQRQFDAGNALDWAKQDLDQAEFNFKQQQYADKLAKETGTGGSGGNGGNGGNTAQQQASPDNNAMDRYTADIVDMMVNYAQNKVQREQITKTLEKDIASQKGDMVTLPVAKANATGTLNQGPLAERTPAMPREQAEELISDIEKLNKQMSKQTTTTQKSTAKTSLALETAKKKKEQEEWLKTFTK